jgi:hypothetical protein
MILGPKIQNYILIGEIREKITFAARKTVLTEFEISGPIPSPGIKET